MQPVLVKLLASLDLSRTEREVAKRFELDPDGRAFLPVADILRAHGHQNEAIEVLLQGVDRHPTFTVARVVLARELFGKGMISDARRVLEDSTSSLRDNILAQKLLFKIHVLLQDEPSARAVHEHLKLNRLLDAEIRRYGEVMELQGFVAARQRLLKDLDDAGIELQAEALESMATGVAGRRAGPGVSPGMSPGSGTGRDPGDASGTGNRTGALKVIGDDEFEIPDEDAVAGFHAVPLKDIFSPDDPRAARSSSPGNLRGIPGPGIELDSTTLADIYARQGHYGKALAIYRRLLRMTPQNELLRRKVADLQEQDRKQRDLDGDVDLAVADRVETLEVIESQIRFYQDLLTSLGG
jgi:tetratricopeptide (TPR) repeat protein